MLAKEREERYMEWLERLEVPIEETATIELFQEWLAGQIEVTPRRLEVLWETARRRYEELAPAGIRIVEIKYPWGRVYRWGIARKAWLRPEEYRPGLWSYREMMRITGWRP